MNRVCKKCGTEKDIELFTKNKKCILGISFSCKICSNIINKKYIRTPESKEKRKERWGAYYKKHIGNVLLRNKNHRKNNKELYRRHSQQNALNLSDSYVKNNLINLGWNKKDITQDIIEVKRLIIKTKRLCKTSQN